MKIEDLLAAAARAEIAGNRLRQLKLVKGARARPGLFHRNWAFRSRVVTGREGLIGKIAVARSPVNGEGGRVFVHGELWNAVSVDPVQWSHALRLQVFHKIPAVCFNAVTS